MSLTTVREALQQPLRAAHPNFRVYPNFRPNMVVPAIVITPSTGFGEKSADYTGRSFKSPTWYLDLIVLVPSQDMDRAQRQLDSLVSPDVDTSIPAILDSRSVRADYADVISYARFTDLRDYGGTYESAGYDHIGACLKLEVEEDCA